MIGSARVSLFALSVCGAPGFGASTALAGQLRAEPICSRLYSGACQDRTQCRQMCASRGSPTEFATRDQGCCYCPI